MAPKKQRANRQLGTSSFDHHRFRKMEAETKYNDIWEYKSVVLERLWRVEQFRSEEFLLYQNFEGRGWLELTQFRANCLVELVREFFANIKLNSIVRRRGSEKIVSWVRGVEIILTPDDFAQVYHLPRVRHPEFSYPFVGSPPLSTIGPEVLIEGQTWEGEVRKPVSVLTDKYWVLHMFSCTNLLPQNRNSDCSPLRARLIHAIGTGLTIDLPSYMWHQVAFVAEHERGLSALPFGGALTAIFTRQGATIPPDTPITAALQPLTQTSLAKSRGTVEGMKKRKITTGPEDDEGPSHPQHEEEETEPEQEDVTTRLGRIELSISQIQRTQETHTHLLQTILDHLRDSQPPPF